MLVVFLLIQLVFNVEGGGVLKLTLTNYTHSFPCQTEKCDFLFDFSLCPVNRSLTDNSCQYLNETSWELEPISLHLTQWHGPALLNIRITYKDNKTTTLDNLETILNITSGNGTQHILQNKTILVITSVLTCDMRFYGNYCSAFCQPRSDDQGHFNCHEKTGEFLCLKGWTGSNCKEKVKNLTPKPPLNSTRMNEAPLKTNQINELVSTTTKPNLVVNQTTSPNVLINEIEHSVSSLIRSTSTWITASDESTPSQINQTDVFTTTPEIVVNLTSSEVETSPATFEYVSSTEVIEEKLDQSEELNYTKNDLVFSFPLNDTWDTKELEATFQSTLSQYIGDVVKYVKTNMSIENKSLHFILDVNNQSALPRIILDINEQRLNIETTFLNEAAIFEKNNGHGRPHSKSVPEWAIILVVVAVILTVVITMRQSHKYCVSRSSMKPKELDEEGESELENVSSALNFTNPIYNKP